MKFSSTVAVTMMAALAAVEAKNPAKARAAQEARVRSAYRKSVNRGIEPPKHIMTMMRSLGLDERKICDAACQERKAAKAAAKAAKAAAKAAAKEAKAAAKAAAKEAKAAAKEAKKAEKAAAKEAKAAEKEAAKEAAQAAKDAIKAEKAAQKAAEAAAKKEAQANKGLKSFKLDRANDWCVPANDFVMWEAYGDVDTWDMGSDMVESHDGYLTVSRPESANTNAGWYLLVTADSDSDVKEIYVDDDDYVSVPGRFHRISGFEDWCEIEEAGSGSGAGSGAGSDELVAVASRQFQSEVTISVGSNDPNAYTWYYCYPQGESVDC